MEYMTDYSKSFSQRLTTLTMFHDKIFVKKDLQLSHIIGITA